MIFDFENQRRNNRTTIKLGWGAVIVFALAVALVLAITGHDKVAADVIHSVPSLAAKR